MANHRDIHYTLNIENNQDDRNDPILVTSAFQQSDIIPQSSMEKLYLIHNQMITGITFFYCFLKSCELKQNDENDEDYSRSFTK